MSEPRLWRSITGVTLALAAFLIAAPPAHAHFRDFTFTRDWFLPFRGEKEIEARSRFLERSGVFEQELEFEYGITPHFAVEPGFAVVRESNGEFHYDAFDMEGRFNLGDVAIQRFLPALNVEYEKPNGTSGRLELKFIVSRFNRNGGDLSLNFNVGRAFSRLEDDPAAEGAHWESEFTAGYVHPIAGRGRAARAKAGLEFIHGLHDGLTNLGPVLVYRAGKEVNFVTSYAFPVDGRDNEGVFRFIAEYEFR